MLLLSRQVMLIFVMQILCFTLFHHFPSLDINTFSLVCFDLLNHVVFLIYENRKCWSESFRVVGLMEIEFSHTFVPKQR